MYRKLCKLARSASTSGVLVEDCTIDSALAAVYASYANAARMITTRIAEKCGIMVDTKMNKPNSKIAMTCGFVNPLRN